MTTIKLKNGSGAPTAGDLAQGEPALDLTNKRLYTEDSGGTVIEVGTNPGVDVTFADDRKAIFGDGSDLQIYHDGNNSLINDTGTGDLRLRTNNKVVIEGSSGEDHAVFNDNGAVQLYFDSGTYSAPKLATTSTGIDVTGTVVSDGLTVDGSAAIDGGSSENTVLTLDSSTANTYLKITDSNSTNGVFIGAATNDLNFYPNNTLSAKFAAGGDISFYDSSGTSQSLFWDASAESLGIGTSSIDNKVNIQESALAGRDASNGNTTLTLEHATDTGIQFFSATQTQLRFGDAASTAAGSIIFEHATNKLRLNTDSLFTVATGGTERMRIDSSGNVGLYDGQYINWRLAPNSTYRGGIRCDSSANMSFETGSGGAEAMRIDSSGNLLVGTTDRLVADGTGTGLVLGGQSDLLHVSRSGGDCAKFNRVSNDGAIVTFSKDGTAVGSIGASGGDLIIGTDDTGLYFWDGDDSVIPWNISTNSSRNGGIDLGNANHRFKDLYLSGNINLSASSQINSSTAFYLDSDIIHFRRNNESESARIDSSGNLLVGTTSGSGHKIRCVATGSDRNLLMQCANGGANAITLNTSGTADYTAFLFTTDGGNTQSGSIVVGASATAYNTSSDQRLKDNIVDAPSASDDIDAIQVRSFDWKTDGSHQKYGMVAQELNTVAPEAVSEGATEEDMMGVDYSKLVPMMLKEIQSLRARVAQLETN